jgi:surface antigen
LAFTARAGAFPAFNKNKRIETMKNKHIICSLMAVGVLAGGLAGCMTEKHSKANLEAEATVSKADAEKTALAQVPGGKIKEGELEKEKGKLIWSFDIATPGTKDITEVQVDALNGGVVSKTIESAADQAKEKQEEAREKKGKKEKDEDEKEEKK